MFTLCYLQSYRSLFCLYVWMQFNNVLHTHRYTHQMLSCTCWHLSHRQPARREATRTSLRGKRQITVKRKKWRSRGKVWVRREREKNEKKRSRVWMYVGWISSYTTHALLILTLVGLSPPCLAAHSSFKPRRRLSLQAATHSSCFLYRQSTYKALDQCLVWGGNALCGEKYSHYVSMTQKTYSAAA